VRVKPKWLCGIGFICLFTMLVRHIGRFVYRTAWSHPGSIGYGFGKTPFDKDHHKQTPFSSPSANSNWIQPKKSGLWGSLFGRR
jgi:hypothetical protein